MAPGEQQVPELRLLDYGMVRSRDQPPLDQHAPPHLRRCAAGRGRGSWDLLLPRTHALLAPARARSRLHTGRPGGLAASPSTQPATHLLPPYRPSRSPGRPGNTHAMTLEALKGRLHQNSDFVGLGAVLLRMRLSDKALKCECGWRQWARGRVLGASGSSGTRAASTYRRLPQRPCGQGLANPRPPIHRPAAPPTAVPVPYPQLHVLLRDLVMQTRVYLTAHQRARGYEESATGAKVCTGGSGAAGTLVG